MGVRSRIRLSEITVKVTRKGQVTIPAEFRKTHGIHQGSRVTCRSDTDGLVLMPLPNIEDTAGVDAGKIKYEKAVKELDRMRSQDRY